MFCEKCGREIARDSVFCSYCAAPVEQEEAQTTAAAAAKAAACIQPHMPKKHCNECGKELPGSAISDFCAMCTIRQRNRELEERRKNDDASYASRDRYDISDEFDQSIFQKNKSNYYGGNTAERFAEANRARGAARHTGPDIPIVKSKNKGLIIAVVVIALCLIPVLIGAFNYTGFDPKPERVEESAAAPASSAAEEPAGDAVMQEPETLEDYQAVYIEPSAEQILASGMTVESVTHDTEELTWDGAFVYTSGTVVYEEEDETKTEHFQLCIIMSESAFVPLMVQVGDDVLMDNRDFLDTDGVINEAGAAYYEQPANESLFDDAVFYPDHMPRKNQTM